MAGRGPRTGGRHAPVDSRHVPVQTRPVPDDTRETRDEAREAYDDALVRVCDLAGRPRGTGFVADHHGTVITSHEAVDGLARLVLHAPGGRTCVVTADAVTPLPDADLALVRSEGLGVDPLPVTVRDHVETGTYVRIAAGGWREARVLGASAVTYTATDRFHLLGDALELAIGTAGADALRLGGGAAGGPVLDASTGAVVAVLGTALHAGHRVAGFAVPLRTPDAEGPLAALLVRNAATVPAYGADLNPAGVLELTATSVGSDGPGGPDGGDSEPVERADVVREFAGFEGGGQASVLGLVGPPGSGRTTELAALAARRARGAEPASTLWLRGADLLSTDLSVADAAARALERAGRIVAASREGPHSGSSADSGVLPPEGYDGELGDIGPERLARVARDAGRPLLLLLDGPEEMPPALAHRMPEWTAGTADWLRETGARLVVACRAEYWEQAGAEFPAELLHRADPSMSGAGRLPACVWLGDLTEAEALRARARAGIPEGALAPADARHPLALRLLSEVRAALPDAPVSQGAPSDSVAGRGGLSDSSAGRGAPSDFPVGLGALPDSSVGWGGLSDSEAGRGAPPDSAARPLDRDEVFAAYLDLMCLRVAVRLAAVNGLRGTAVRRLAAHVSGQVHEAARRCLGPGQGELDRASFEAVFPWGPAPVRRLGATTGWASAVLTEGLLVPAGNGYRFAHEELADWIQGTHLDLDPALHALVHRGRVAALAQAGTAGAVRPVASATTAGSAERAPESAGAASTAGTATARVPSWADRQERPAGDVEAAARVSEPAEEAGKTRGSGAAASRRRARGPRFGATPAPPRALPVPRHRIGPVVQALLLLARQQGPGELARRLEDLVDAVDDLLPEGPAPLGDPGWWATHLCVDVLLRVPDASPYAGVLRLLAERIVRWREQGRGVPGEFGPAFWEALPLPEEERFELLRCLVVADEAPRTGRQEGEPRYLDAVARLLTADPTAVQPHLTHWFDDDRPLPATPHATVATAAQALLYAYRRRALDDLAEALVAVAHRLGDELLAVLAEEEPSAVCRAVDRWAHDERPARRVAAVAYGLRAAPQVRTEADRALLRYAALALLARPADCTLHGGALGLLVRDPWTRARYLPQALERFTAGDPQLPASALVAALTTHPDPVFAAFRARLWQPGAGPDTGELLRTLADVTTPGLARRVAALVREAVEIRPAAAAHVAAYVDRRLEHGTEAYTVLFPLVTGLIDGCPAPVRAALATVLAAPGGPASRPLRRELLDLLLAHERDPAVLDTLLRAVAADAARRGEEPTRELVHRTGLLLVRTPAGATGFDRGLVDLARTVPGFAGLVAGWLTGAPEEWAGVVGPSTRRMIENLAGVRVPA
ncbi:trypsin-like peptidase domain-containing protein [Streptomyces sp. NPDC060065]|uniref:trypsin-like peptidase domain-containing protein n=1 Tax=Streptomyces sp. NPDC060065 TaxID=3347050 RepID=UPI0036BC0C0D